MSELSQITDWVRERELEKAGTGYFDTLASRTIRENASSIFDILRIIRRDRRLLDPAALEPLVYDRFKEYWSANKAGGSPRIVAMRLIAAVMIDAAISGRPAPDERAADGKSYKTALGRNIDRYRIECGWSLDELADGIGIDKKLILGHVNKGKGARPFTLKLYADAFSKMLKRNITVADLLS